MSLEFRIGESSPTLEFFGRNEGRVVEPTGGTPHVAYRVIRCKLTGLSHLLEFVNSKRSNIVKILQAVRNQILLNLLEQVVLEHALNDVLRRANHVVILFANLNLGQHRLVDVESLVDNLYLLSRLGLVPVGERVQDVLHVDVVRPVVNLKSVLAVCGKNTGDAHYHSGYDRQQKTIFLHFFFRGFNIVNKLRLAAVTPHTPPHRGIS